MNNKKVAVVGYGLEGKDLVNYLLNKGFDVTIFDKKNKKDLDILQRHKKLMFVTGKNYLSEGLDKYQEIFRSPGVYRYKKELVEAEKKGSVISSASILFFDNCPAKIIAVTGTKGKGTTSSLIFEILKLAKKDVYLVGNIGSPFLEILPRVTKDTWIVTEMSSFQLIDLQKSPSIAVVLNITEDHLDWHENIQEYIDAKKNIVKHQTDKDLAVINSDYEISNSFQKITKAEVFLTSINKKVNGCYVADGKIILEVDKQKSTLGNVDKLILRGKHNWENICSASLASFLAGCDFESIKKTIFSFKGLEHRLEFVKTVNGISFYNDSFATGPQPTIAAIRSFNEPVTLILGGYDKNLSYNKMFQIISQRENIKNIFLIGDLEKKFDLSLRNTGFDGNIYKMGKRNIKDIVKKTFEVTEKGGAVILSPAAASFDMFDNYKQRGKLFKEAVDNL